jgi:ParB family chromosome partitioning protein
MDPIVKAIPLSQIHPSPHQARKTFDTDNLRGLAESMKQEGLMNPVVVRKVAAGYELISGERRLRAAKLLGWHALEAKVIGTVSEAEAAAKGLIENIQREDLNTIEEAEGYKELNRLDPKYWTQNKIAQNCGKTQGHVSEFLRFLTLPEVVKGYIRRRILTAGHAAELIRIKKPNAQKKLAHRILKGKWSVMQTREAVDRKLGKKPFPASDSRPSKTQDPFAAQWPEGAWEVAYGPRKLDGLSETQEPVNCWSFVVPHTPEFSQEELAQWFRKMADALEPQPDKNSQPPAPSGEPEETIEVQTPIVSNGSANGHALPPTAFNGNAPVPPPLHSNGHGHENGNGNRNGHEKKSEGISLQGPGLRSAVNPRVSMMLPANETELVAMTREREKLRLPQTAEEVAELEALAAKGPFAVYQWIYGADSVTASKVQGRAWAEWGVGDPAAGARGMVIALRKIQQLSKA